LNNINIGYLSDGLYVLNLSSGNYHQKMKFIKE
jgi:hypothetical protein